MTNTITTRELIINELGKKGYNAIANDVIKNGVTLAGICIHNGSNIAPVIYLDGLLEHFNNIDDIINNIINVYEAHKSIDIDIALLTNHDWILNNVYIALQKSSQEQLIKKPCEFDGIEQYLYIRGCIDQDGWSVKLNPSIMEIANLSLSEVWNAATTNTFSSGETVIQSMASIMAEMIGYPDPDETKDVIPTMYVITNRSRVKGSSAILDIESIRYYFSNLDKEYHKLIVIPSSIHECILVPVDDEVIDLEQFNAMVREVNSSEVDKTEQLSSHCYVLSI